MTNRRYATPNAFKQALEQRLKLLSLSGADFARRRQLLVYDRFLVRVIEVLGDSVTLKGGLVLELRLDRARTTKDVDLCVMGPLDEVYNRLQDAGRLDLGDFMRFEVQPDPHHPNIKNDGMQYDGYRFRTECRLAGKVYGRPFGVDVAFGDPIVGEPDLVVADDILDFAGLEPPTIRVYPIVSHVAEKLHAYTMPRSRPNSRIKDLPDMALLASIGPIEGVNLRAGLERTFQHRATHSLPLAVPEPPVFWGAPYEVMATNDGLVWRTLPDLQDKVAAFLNPVLQGEANGLWDPERWAWRARKSQAAKPNA